MKTWIYTANSYYKTASYILEEGPWWSFALEWLVETICESLWVIPIPFGSKIKTQDCTAKEYYGDISGVFHVYICMPVTVFCYKKRQETRIETDYEQLKKERQWEAPELFEEGE
ncbi:MAG: hypothetical protein ACLFNL_09520 [Bacteroidales bacterium]